MKGRIQPGGQGRGDAKGLEVRVCPACRGRLGEWSTVGGGEVGSLVRADTAEDLRELVLDLEQSSVRPRVWTWGQTAWVQIRALPLTSP